MIYLHKIVLEWVLRYPTSALVVDIIFGSISLLVILLFHFTKGE